jgi:thiamine-phosphate pyrophosphorylase
MAMLARCPCETWSVSDRRERLAEARLYLICDAREDAFLHAALDGGVELVQLRMKDAGEQAIVEAGRRFARVCAEHGALFILNDRPDLVATAGADGVHVGQDDCSPAEARALVGNECLIGVSTHSEEQIDAIGEQVDYIGVGPVYATPTKPGRPAVGLDLVGYAAQHARVPFFAIGGIDTGNAAEVRGAGAQRLAVVRALSEADDPERAARDLLGEVAVGTAQP